MAYKLPCIFVPFYQPRGPESQPVSIRACRRRVLSDHLEALSGDAGRRAPRSSLKRTGLLRAASERPATSSSLWTLCRRLNETRQRWIYWCCCETSHKFTIKPLRAVKIYYAECFELFKSVVSLRNLLHLPTRELSNQSSFVRLSDAQKCPRKHPKKVRECWQRARSLLERDYFCMSLKLLGWSLKWKEPSDIRGEK